VVDHTLDATERELEECIGKNAVENTKKAYAPYKEQFKKFCKINGHVHFPARPHTLGLFMRDCLEGRNLAVSTINQVVTAAVADDYRFSKHTSPSKSRIVKAVKKVVARKGKKPTQKRPLLPSMLIKMVGLMELKEIDIRDIALLSFMVFGMLRQSEAVALSAEDVWLDWVEAEGKQVQVLFIFVEKSKTDQERLGHTIVVSSLEGKEHISPLVWYTAYTKIRSVRSAFFFSQIGNSKGLAKRTPNWVVKRWCEKLGIDGKMYGSHSCRRGGCTAAAASGIEMRLIQRHGNWRSLCVFKYMVDTWEDKLSVSRAIAGSAVRPSDLSSK
jgi:integrase